MKRIFRLPALAGGVVMAAVLASLVPTTSSRVLAQVTVSHRQNSGYYNPYDQGYAASSRAKGNLFPSHGGMFGSRAAGYSGNGTVPSGHGNRFNYDIGPHVRVYGRWGYYQPSRGPVYVPFGNED